MPLRAALQEFAPPLVGVSVCLFFFFCKDGSALAECFFGGKKNMHRGKWYLSLWWSWSKSESLGRCSSMIVSSATLCLPRRVLLPRPASTKNATLIDVCNTIRSILLPRKYQIGALPYLQVPCALSAVSVPGEFSTCMVSLIWIPEAWICLVRPIVPAPLVFLCVRERAT